MAPFSLSIPHFLLLLLSSAPFFSFSQQLPASQSQFLFRLRRILEYPTPLSSWNRYTSFCSLPPSPSLSISCSAAGQITSLSISGSCRAALSPNFSADSLFTTLSRLNTLTCLSFVSLGIWGPLPSKIKRLSSLKVLNLSSNYLSGNIPPEISSMQSLESLVLSRNLFNATVPDLKPLSLLGELDLSGNSLGPGFPSLGRNIAILDLQNNTFKDKIPMDLSFLDRLRKLDLSSNQLIGPIPSFLFSLPSVQYLDLSSNKFKGFVPANLKCGKNLTFVDLSRNLLMGSLPSCIKSNSSSLVVLSSWNCLASMDSRYQHPNSYCGDRPLAAVLPAAERKERSKANLGLILSLVGGIIGGLVVIGLSVFLVFRKMKSRNNWVTFFHKPINLKTSNQFPPKTLADTRHMSQAVIIGTLGLTPYRVFSMEELEDATNGFDPSNLVSEGPQGKLLKGWLRDGCMVIVRSLEIKQKNSSHSIAQYIDVISKLRHRHLVSVLGHCIVTDPENANTPNIVFLVYEYVTNGTLRSHLTEWRKRELLKWPQRVTAVIGVARGIQFLHTFMSPFIMGNDLDIDNILLDETLTAKISTYNISMFPKNNISNMVSFGSPFNVGEESNVGSLQNFENAEKQDIYQLGLILLEVITGKPAGSQSGLDALKAKLQKSLSEPLVKLRALTDPTIRNTFAYESLRTAAEIALKCVSKDARERPSVDDVLWNLQYCIQIQDGWASSENLSTQT